MYSYTPLWKKMEKKGATLNLTNSIYSLLEGKSKNLLN